MAGLPAAAFVWVPIQSGFRGNWVACLPAICDVGGSQLVVAGHCAALSGRPGGSLSMDFVLRRLGVRETFCSPREARSRRIFMRVGGVSLQALESQQSWPNA